VEIKRKSLIGSESRSKFLQLEEELTYRLRPVSISAPIKVKTNQPIRILHLNYHLRPSDGAWNKGSFLRVRLPAENFSAFVTVVKNFNWFSLD